MSGTFKVAGLQMACRVGDVKGNVEKACNMIEKAAQEGARLICLPEMFNTGYFSYTGGQLDTAYWDLAEPLSDSWTLNRIGEVAEKYRLNIVAPFVEKANHGIYYNSAALIGQQGEVVGCYRKVHIPFSLTGCEKFYFRPGYDFPVFNTSIGKLGIQICFDRDFPEGYRTLALKGAEIIVHPNGAPRYLAELWRIILRVRAYENGVFIMGACLTGKSDDKSNEFVGNSLLVSPRGEILASLDYEEDILLAEVDLGAIEDARRRRFGMRDRRPEMYGKLTEMV